MKLSTHIMAGILLLASVPALNCKSLKIVDEHKTGTGNELVDYKVQASIFEKAQYDKRQWLIDYSLTNVLTPAIVSEYRYKNVKGAPTINLPYVSTAHPEITINLDNVFRSAAAAYNWCLGPVFFSVGEEHIQKYYANASEADKQRLREGFTCNFDEPFAVCDSLGVRIKNWMSVEKIDASGGQWKSLGYMTCKPGKEIFRGYRAENLR